MFIAMVPQWDLLNLLTEAAQTEASFTLRMNTEATGLLREGNRVTGVRYRDRDGTGELRAELTVGCDGRRSTVRQAAGLTGREYPVNFDAWWFRLPHEGPAQFSFLPRIGPAKALVVIPRKGYFQIGTVELMMSCEPAFDYHRIGATWEYSAAAYGEAVARAKTDSDAHPTLRLTTNLRIGLEGREARARTRLKEGDDVFVALSWSKHPAPQTYADAAEKMWQTTGCWRQWINIGNFPDHPWRAYLQRSALTLKGLTYSPTGALLAASTTSLPESPRGQRNWDYRYAWIRDSTFALWGLYTLGLDREADDFFSFIADVSGANNGERHPLQVMYGVGGSAPSKKKSCTISPATTTRARSVSATAPTTRTNTTFGATFSTRSTCTPDPVSRSPRRCGRCSRRRWKRRSSTGASPTGGSGRFAANRSTSCRRRWLAGWRSTAAPNWPRARVRRRTPRSGVRSPTRSRPTSSNTGSTLTACSPSPTEAMRWMLRCSWWC